MDDSLPSAPVWLGVVDELLTNIKRSCVRGRNAADLTPENSSFIATFDHIEDLAQQAQRALSRSAPVGVEAVRGAWLAAITLANNICVQESDRENDRDGDTGWIKGTAECAKRIREYARPTDAELLEMLDEAGANAAKAALAQQPAAAGEESSKGADVARPKRRPYNASASLSEYGVFPECDAQQPAEGEDIMVNTPYDVFTLPLRPSGLDGKGPRFVVHVPGPEQPAAVDEAMVERACKAAAAQCAPDEIWPDTYEDEDADDLRATMKAALTAALSGVSTPVGVAE